MKKLTVIISLIIITVFSTSSFFIFSGYLSSYKKTFHSFIKQEQRHLSTTQISINPSELFVNSNSIAWEDNNKEIIIKGKMYDIVSINSCKGKVILTVISDTQEDILKKEFASTYDLQSNNTLSNPIKLLKQFLSLKFIQNSDQAANGLFNSFAKSSIIDATFDLCSVALNNETPPPSLLA